jgi:hypothetical protein
MQYKKVELSLAPDKNAKHFINNFMCDLQNFTLNPNAKRVVFDVAHDIHIKRSFFDWINFEVEKFPQNLIL